MTNETKHTGVFSEIYPQATIWEFDTTGEAYDASQTDDLAKGDILYIPSEGVVGFADTWPFAISCKRGDLHSVDAPYDQYYHTTAAGVARALGFPEAQVRCALFMQARVHLEERQASAYATAAAHPLAKSGQPYQVSDTHVEASA